MPLTDRILIWAPGGSGCACGVMGASHITQRHVTLGPSLYSDRKCIKKLPDSFLSVNTPGHPGCSCRGTAGIARRSWGSLCELFPVKVMLQADVCTVRVTLSDASHSLKSKTGSLTIEAFLSKAVHFHAKRLFRFSPCPAVWAGLTHRLTGALGQPPHPPKFSPEAPPFTYHPHPLFLSVKWRSSDILHFLRMAAGLGVLGAGSPGTRQLLWWGSISSYIKTINVPQPWGREPAVGRGSHCWHLAVLHLCFGKVGPCISHVTYRGATHDLISYVLCRGAELWNPQPILCSECYPLWTVTSKINRQHHWQRNGLANPRWTAVWDPSII